MKKASRCALALQHGRLTQCSAPPCSPARPLRCRRVIIEKYYQRLTQDFDTNQRICEEVAIIQSKRLRNKIAGFTTVR